MILKKYLFWLIVKIRSKKGKRKRIKSNQDRQITAKSTDNLQALDISFPLVSLQMTPTAKAVMLFSDTTNHYKHCCKIQHTTGKGTALLLPKKEKASHY